MVQALKRMETGSRMHHLPSLMHQVPPLEAEDYKEQLANGSVLPVDISNVHACCGLAVVEPNDDNPTTFLAASKRRNLIVFSLDMFLQRNGVIEFDRITELNVSHDELMELPGLSRLNNLVTLNLNQN